MISQEHDYPYLFNILSKHLKKMNPESKTPTQIINDIRNGEPYSFKGKMSGNTFTISFNGSNFILNTPKSITTGKKKKPQGMSQHMLETTIFNSLQP